MVHRTFLVVCLATKKAPYSQCHEVNISPIATLSLHFLLFTLLFLHIFFFVFFIFIKLRKNCLVRCFCNHTDDYDKAQADNKSD